MTRLERMWQAWRVEATLFAGMVLALWFLATLFRQDATHISYAAHFVAQAQSWLQGRLDVPAWLGHDLVQVGNKDYIVYPPMPALLMVPFVAVLGSHFSDIWFSWLVGAANVALLFHLLQAVRAKGWSIRATRENAIIALVFGLGSIALWLALGGTVWFIAQTLAVTFTLGMLLGVVRQHWWLASASLGALFLTRSPDILGAVVIAVAAWQALGAPRWGNVPGAWHKMVLALTVPLGAALALWLVRNQLYFGGWFSSGYDLQIRQDYPQIHYGLLSWHYIWPNIVVDFLNLPAFVFHSPYDPTPVPDLLVGGNGTSAFFTTPLFLLFFRARASHAPTWLRRAMWATVALLLLFTLCWNLTGWYQVGARYLFDLYPYLFVLLAMRSDAINARWLALAGFGVLVNLALANVFWCGGGACLGTQVTPRWIAFGLVLFAVPLACGLAWWWLRQEPRPAPVMQPLRS